MSLRREIEQKPIASEKWAEIKDYMATHLYGKPPVRLFKTRRPLESTNTYALDYRTQNFQPITKQPFNVAVAAILETAGHIYVREEGLEDATKEFIDDWEIYASGKWYNLKNYITRYVAYRAEADPNAALVILPKHPREPFIPDYREELPNFNNMLNENIELDAWLVGSQDIHYVSSSEIWFKGGDYLYKIQDDKEFYKPYYWLVNKEYTRLAVPYATDKGYEYRIEDYYFNDLETAPFDCIGYNAVQDEIDGEIVEFYEPTYSGAVAIGNEVLGIKSDSQILDTRFTYPEKYQYIKRCGHPASDFNADPTSPYYGKHVVYNAEGSCSVCPGCDGSGLIAPDTSPLGTHWMSKDDEFHQEGKFVPPTVFITPPLESPEYLDKKWRMDFAEMRAALFIIDQNMTNQSGESKSYDVRQKVQVISAAVKNIYSIYENALNTVQGYLRGPEEVELILPPDLNIKTSQDITIELGDSKNTSSLYTSQLTKELVLKKFGNSQENRRAVDFLELYDKLFGFTMEEVVRAKAIYGNALTARDFVIHDKGFAILKSLMSDDFLTISDEELKRRFDEAVDMIAPVIQPVSPIA